jgi:hypothetical protein
VRNDAAASRGVVWLRVQLLLLALTSSLSGISAWMRARPLSIPILFRTAALSIIIPAAQRVTLLTQQSTPNSGLETTLTQSTCHTRRKPGNSFATPSPSSRSAWLKCPNDDHISNDDEKSAQASKRVRISFVNIAAARPSSAHLPLFFVLNCGSGCPFSCLAFSLARDLQFRADREDFVFEPLASRLRTWTLHTAASIPVRLVS